MLLGSKIILPAGGLPATKAVDLAARDFLVKIQRFAPHASHVTLQAFIAGARSILPPTDICATAQRFCHLLAQIGTETALFTADEENLNYSAAGLMKTFGVGTHSSAQITPEEAKMIAHKRELIAERVYGVGNPKKPNFLGNTQAGDGWKFRGRGMLQLTGRDQYTRYSKYAGVDLVETPELAKDATVGLRIAAALWRLKNCNQFADLDQIIPITRAINGGLNGLHQRRANYHHARRIWG